MTRDDIIRMAREAGGGVALTLSSTPGIACTEFRGGALERFVSLVAYHARATVAPIMIDAKSIDPEILRGMLEKAAPMPIVAMPPSDEVAAAVAAEREAWQSVQAQNEQLKARIARVGLEGNLAKARAVHAEREACAEEADYYAKHSRTAHQIAAAIRARGTP